MSDDALKTQNITDASNENASTSPKDTSQDVIVGNKVPQPSPVTSKEKPKGLHGDSSSGDVRSDSEAETVVLSGKDEASNGVNRMSIKHERTMGLTPRTTQDDNTKATEGLIHNIDFNASLDLESAAKKASGSLAADANNSSNLSSTVSSPALDGRSSSITRSESIHSRSKHQQENEYQSKNLTSRKRKLRADDVDEKSRERRKKRDAVSETTNLSDRREVRTVSHGRSESPPTRSRIRAQSAQSADAQGTHKRRKPAPLQVSHRRKGSEEAYADSDDSNPSHGPAHFRKLLSVDNNATMSPAKIPHKKHRDKNGRTWLARACAAEEVDNAIARLQERPEDLDIADNAGNTPLQIASLEGNADIVKVLLDAGCDITCRNIDQDTPLIDAVENGHLDVVKLLLKAGLDPRQSNAKGEEPLDLLNLEGENYAEIKKALQEAREWDAQRRPSEDHHGQFSVGRESISAQSPHGSPPLHSTRSPPPHGLGPRRKTARSEASRSDLLWVNPTPENLRYRAGKGDDEGVDHILNMRPMGDIEAVLAAAKGGHEICLQLLIAIGKPVHDPEPLQSSAYKSGFNTPMLAAIGRGNVRIIQLLLEQSEFDPTRQLYRNLTYFEIAKERQGSNWQEEYDMLKDAYDKASGTLPNRGSFNRVRGEAKKLRRDKSSSSPLHRSKRQSPEVGMRNGVLKKRRSTEGKSDTNSTNQDGQRKAQNGNRTHLRVPLNDINFESPAVFSDREATPQGLSHEKKTKRSFSDAGTTASTGDMPKPRKRLVSGKDLRNDEEKRRRASQISLASSSSSQGQAGAKSTSESLSRKVKHEENKEETKWVNADLLKKRPRRTISPSNSKSPDGLKPSEATKKLKRQRIDSNGNAIARDAEETPQPGPAKVANMIPSSQKTNSPPVQGAAPVAFMGNPSSSPVKDPPDTDISRMETDSPVLDDDQILQRITYLQDLEAQREANEKESLRVRQQAQVQQTKIKKEEADKLAAEKLETERCEREKAKQLADEEAARFKAERIARQEEESRLEQLRLEEAERIAQIKREEEEALVEKEREAEEQKKLAEQERLRAEEQERQRERERVEKEELERTRQKAAEERQRRERLPNSLKIAAELNFEDARSRNEINWWLPLYTANGYQLNATCEGQARDERWITNIQAAPILATPDLGLAQCTTLTKCRVSEDHRTSLWRVLRLQLTRFELLPHVKYNAKAELEKDAETRKKFFSLEEVFWIKLSEFMDIIPQYPHLANIPISTGTLALTPPNTPKDILQTDGSDTAQSNRLHQPLTNGTLTNGYH